MLNQEIKGNLARLLATENLVVEHKKVQTASFDIERRVLTLPMWDASVFVFDMLVGHEVGHALYTPASEWREVKDIPRGYINIVEDARIEKMMKRKYPGLTKTFFRGYQELDNDDFFSVAGVELDTIPFIDRINLHCKVGVFSVMPFSDEERILVSKVEECETFEDVLSVCREIQSLVKQQKEQEQQQQQQSSPQSSQGNGAAGHADSEEEMTHEEMLEEAARREKESEIEVEVDEDAPAGGMGGGETFTQDAFDKNIAEKLNSDNPWDREDVYVQLPDVNLERIVVDNAALEQHIENHFNTCTSTRFDDVFSYSDNIFNEFKKGAQKEVNYLVKEFECKKSADAYARSGTSRTGVLDTSKLHTYKFNEDLFKKVTVLPDGKNHGMIFILDWSGSMSNYLKDTVKQLLSLVWFCRKVQIPFEVYAFTYEWNDAFFNEEAYQKFAAENYDDPNLKAKRAQNQMTIHKRFSLLNLLTSRCNSKSFEIQTRNLYRIAHFMSFYNVPSPPGLDLSGTPLNEAIISLHKIIPQFKKTADVQKVNCVILTDGESNGISYDQSIREGDKHSFWGHRHVCNECRLRDRKTGNVYRNFQNNYNDSVTSILLENLCDNYPEVNILGFRILSGSDFSYLYRNTYYEPSDTIIKQWRKDKAFVMHNKLGYDSLYLIASTALTQSTEFNVEDTASKAQITKAFKTMLNSKRTNKKVLSSFIEMVA